MTPRRGWLAAVAVIGALVVGASSADASPKRRDAKAAFERGVTAYQKGDFAAASEALGTSYKLEPDVETLFAWAQAERQLERCDRALDLYGKLLEYDLPAENKKAVQVKIDECKALIAAQKPKQPEKPAPPPPPEPVREPEPPPPAPAKVVEEPRGEEGRAPWWKDPIGDSLVIAGAAGLGVGAYFLFSGSKAENDSQKEYVDWGELNDKAKRHGKIGVIAAAAGGVLVIGGVVRYATRGGSSKERTAVSGWLSPEGGGIAAIGRF